MPAANASKLVFFTPSAYAVRGWINVLAAVVTVMAYFLNFSPTTVFLISLITFFAGGDLFLRAALQEFDRGYVGFNAFITLSALAAFLFGILNTFSAAPAFAVSGAFLMLPFIFGVANFIKTFELKSIGASVRFINNLDNFIPKSAYRVSKTGTEKVFTYEIKEGETILISVGERVPLDCRILKGSTMIDENLLTGNITLTSKRKGDMLFAGCVNKGSEVTAEVTAVKRSSRIYRVIEAVKAGEKRKILSVSALERYSFTMLVSFFILAAVVAALMFFIFNPKNAFYCFMSFLFVMSLSGPIPYMAAVLAPLGFLKKGAAKNKIFINNITCIKTLGECKKIFIDKTGTLTSGHLEVACAVPAEGVKEKDLFKAACTAQRGTNNIFSAAIAEYCAEAGIKPERVLSSEIYPSYGTSVGTSGGGVIYAGRKTWLESKGIVIEQQEELKKTVFYVSKNDKFMGSIYFSDRLRPNVKETVKYFKSLRKKLCLLSGDNTASLKEVARRAGIDEFYGDIYPDEKAAKVLSHGAPTVMAGDGFNDILAMLQADVSVAFISAGENVFTGWVDITVKNKDFICLKKIFEFERSYKKLIKQNIYISVILSLVTIYAALILKYSLSWYALIGVAIFAILFILINSARLEYD